MRNRGVSNVFGYVLLFAVVLSSITVVGTVGVGQLTDARDGTLALNAEHTMTGLASAVDDVHKENVSRTSRVQLGSGALEPGDQTDITVDVGGSTVTRTVDPIVYRTGNTRLIYVAGAVFRVENDGEFVVQRPNYRPPDSTDMILSLPVTKASDPDKVVSGSNAQVFLSREFGSATVDSDSSVTIEFDTPSNRRAELWETALEDQFDSCDVNPPAVSDDTIVECDYTDPVLFRVTETNYKLST